jgi:hypothetical protein
LRRILSDQVQC